MYYRGDHIGWYHQQLIRPKHIFNVSNISHIIQDYALAPEASDATLPSME